MGSGSFVDGSVWRASSREERLVSERKTRPETSVLPFQIQCGLLCVVFVGYETLMNRIRLLTSLFENSN